MSQQSLVVTVTETLRIDLLVTAVDFALAPLPQWPGGTGNSRPQYPPMMHLAVSACHGGGVASFHLTLLPHEHNVSAATDRSACVKRRNVVLGLRRTWAAPALGVSSKN